MLFSIKNEINSVECFVKFYNIINYMLIETIE